MRETNFAKTVVSLRSLRSCLGRLCSSERSLGADDQDMGMEVPTIHKAYARLM